MDSGNVAAKSHTRQAPPELTAATKRLLLSAHLGLVFKKLRRGLCIEEQELLALLPFTVPNGRQSDDAACGDSNDAAVIDSGDEDWARRLAEVHKRSGLATHTRSMEAA